MTNPVDYDHQQQPKAGGPVKLVAILIAGAILVGGGVVAYVLLSSKPATSPAVPPPVATQAVAKPSQKPVLLDSPAFTGNAEEMLADVLKDKNAFHSSRYNKVIEVTGEVTAIRDDITGQRFLALSGGVERTLGIRCFFADANRFQLEELGVGQTVVVRGRYESVEPDVILRDAGMVKVVSAP